MTIDEVWQVHVKNFRAYREIGLSRQFAVLKARVDTYAHFIDKGNRGSDVAYMWKKGKERAMQNDL